LPPTRSSLPASHQPPATLQLSLLTMALRSQPCVHGGLRRRIRRDGHADILLRRGPARIHRGFTTCPNPTCPKLLAQRPPCATRAAAPSAGCGIAPHPLAAVALSASAPSLTPIRSCRAPVRAHAPLRCSWKVGISGMLVQRRRPHPLRDLLCLRAVSSVQPCVCGVPHTGGLLRKAGGEAGKEGGG